MAANGTFQYTPQAGFNGTDSFTYQANDGQLESAPATVTIEVTAAAQATLAAELIDDVMAEEESWLT
jgi:hypothetical protein